MTLTLAQYYKSFLSVRGLFAAAFTLMPAWSVLKPGRIFPPLGNETSAAQFFAVTLGAATTYVVYLSAKNMSDARIRRTIIGLLVTAVVLFCAYFCAQLRFVRVVPIPALGQDEVASVGFARTQFANLAFGDLTDEDLLRKRGIDDEQIRKLWTTESIVASRLTLLFSYLGCCLPIVGITSLGVLMLAREVAGEPGTG